MKSCTNNDISIILGVNPYKYLLKSIKIGQKECQYYDISSFDSKYGKINFLFITSWHVLYLLNKFYIFNFCYIDRLPFSIRVLLESVVRNCDGFQVTKSDVEKVLDWEKNQALGDGVEVAFKPARVLLQVKSKNFFDLIQHI